MFDEKFWLALAFFLFVGSIYVFLRKKIVSLLDDKTKEVENKILSAKNSLEEAVKNLVLIKKELNIETEKSIKLIEDSLFEANKILNDIEVKIQKEYEVKIMAAKERIRVSKENLIRNIKEIIVSDAIDKFENNLINLSVNEKDLIADKSIKEIKNFYN